MRVSRTERSPRRTSRLARSSARSAKRQQLVGRLLAGHSAQERPQARQELLERERLGQVVVGPRVQTGHPVGHGVPGGEQQHGDVVPCGAQRAARLQAVEPRHHHVEHHGVGTVLADEPQRLLAVGRSDDLIAVERKRTPQGLPHGGIVICHEYAHASSV